MKNNFFDKFTKYELDNHLFDIKFKDINIWEIMRTYIYIEIEQIMNSLQPLFPPSTEKKRKQFSIKILINSLKIFFVKNKDLIFLNNPRRVKQKNGKYYCKYTDPFIEIVKGRYSYITLEDPYWSLSPSNTSSHFLPVETQSICFLDAMEYMFRFKKYFFKKYNKKEYKKLQNILTQIRVKIENEFQCDLSNIFSVAEDKVLYMVLLKTNYEKIINRLKPKAILEFYDAFPSKILINKIAKDNNIPIIEIQHGVVTRYNPIFLKYKDVNRKYYCTPDYVFSYGKKLLNCKNMPIAKNSIYYIGNVYLNSKKKEYEKLFLKSNKKNILFISQSNLGKYISEFASELANLLSDSPEYHIIYKMHPYEIGATYDCLNKTNITIINDRENDLYYYQSISIAQVGIYSTGIYEGLIFDLPTYIINNDYGTSEIKEILGNEKGIYYINDAKDVVDLLPKNKKINISNKYWQNIKNDKIVELLSSIVDTRKQCKK